MQPLYTLPQVPHGLLHLEQFNDLELDYQGVNLSLLLLGPLLQLEKLGVVGKQVTLLADLLGLGQLPVDLIAVLYELLIAVVAVGGLPLHL